MNLYFIKNMNVVGYDHVEGYVIAARNESEVRNLASSMAAGEGVKTWLGGDTGSKITVIGTAASNITKPTIIQRAFNAG